MTSLLATSPPSAPPDSRSPDTPVQPAREVATFVGLVTAMVLGIAFALPSAGLAPLLTMITPLVAVLLITLLRTPSGARCELWGTFGLKHACRRSWPIAFAICVVVVFVIPYGAAVLLGSARIGLEPSNTPLNLAINLVINLALLTILAMTEEIGWRAYMLPHMQMLVSRRRAALVVGFIHGLFHLPLILLTDTYDNVGNPWIVAPTVVLAITAAGVFYAWLRDRSGSVLAGRLRPRNREPVPRRRRPDRHHRSASPGLHRNRIRPRHPRLDHRLRNTPPGPRSHLESAQRTHNTISYPGHTATDPHAPRPAPWTRCTLPPSVRGDRPLGPARYPAVPGGIGVIRPATGWSAGA